MNNFVLCSNGNVMDNCTGTGTGCCYSIANENDKSLLSYCESTSKSYSQKTTMMSFSKTLSYFITSLSTESIAPIPSNNLPLSTGEAYATQTTTTLLSSNLLQFTEVTAIQTTTTLLSSNLLQFTDVTAIQTTTTLLSNNLLQFTTEVVAIQTTTQSIQDTTHINNLTIITISLGGILLLIVLTLAVICVILSVVIIAKKHHQFQPGKCNINNNQHLTIILHYN